MLSYPRLESARTQVAAFLKAIPPEGPVAVLCDGDVDGLGAAVTLVHHLRDDPRFVVTHVPKGLNAFTPTVREKIAAIGPVALIVLDLGIRDFEIAPGVPTLLIDHHRPLGVPPAAVAISGYEWDPVPTSSLLTYLLVGEGAPAWKAALGNAGDLGPEYEPFAEAAKAQKSKWMKEATSLLNAAKRSSDPDRAIPLAYRIFKEAATAAEIATRDDAVARELRELQDEMKRELAESRRVAPKFSKTEPIALLRFDSPARVQPLLAQSWRGRLPKYIVMAANGGYLPGRVAFSLRTNADFNLLDLLARHGAVLGLDEPEYGLGHDKATGGSLSDENFARLLASMGFEEPSRSPIGEREGA